MNDILLSVRDLEVSFPTPAGEVRAVDGISFDVRRGETLGLVGESGCGKSAAMLSVMGLTPGRGTIYFDGQNLKKCPMEDIRGKRISMIFQDPMTSLNPVLTVGYQIEEPLRRHGWQRNKRVRVLEMLERVGIVPPEARAGQYPHEFSGGQRQRVMIAMAMICNPELLIADEPTTALDVTVQARILELMRELKNQSGQMSVILITHDLSVVASSADRVMVMYGGRIVERGACQEVFQKPSHPYTRGLLRSVPNPKNLKERLVPIEGQPPILLDPPAGCRYVPRCPHAMRVCLDYAPPPVQFSETHSACCWLFHRPAHA